jgi:hypothetical protein
VLPLDSVRQVIRYAYATIRNKASNKVARTSAGRCEVQKEHVIWYVVAPRKTCRFIDIGSRLGTHAFHAVLSRKAPNYSSFLRQLDFELSLPRYKRSKKRFRTLVKEGLILMAEISF